MQTKEDKLDSISETVISIPFGGSDDESDFEDEQDVEDDTPGLSFPCTMYTPPELTYRDLPEGPRLRMRAYEEAFARCRSRAQEVLRIIHAPTTARVIDAVQNAYRPCEEDRLMPYTELRAIAISGTDRSTTSTVLENVRRILLRTESDDVEGKEAVGDDGEEVEGLQMKSPVVVSMLMSTDCTNLSSAMRSMIGGFLRAETGTTDDYEEEERPKRTLAPYDINILKEWYEKLRRSNGEDDLPKLVVLVTDLEKIDPTIIQDLFYICSLHVPHLPLVFILGLSTPPTPSYLHTAFSRKTRTLLHITRIEVTGGIEVLERVLLDTFFNPEFKPAVMLSPAAFAFILEQFNRTAQSIELVMSILQLMHLRHFVDPLSVMTHNELLGTASIEFAAEALSTPSTRPFLFSILARLQHTKLLAKENDDLDTNEVNPNDDVQERNHQESPKKFKGKEGKAPAPNSALPVWLKKSPLDALMCIRDLREAHESQLLRTQSAFRITTIVRRHLLDANVLRICVGGGGGMGNHIGTEVEMMSACLRGTLPGREGKALANGIRKLESDSLVGLIYQLATLVRALPSDARVGVPTVALLGEWNSRLDAIASEDYTRDEDVGDVANDIARWLTKYISDNMHDFTETDLWDIWYTKNPTGIAEIFNPATRPAIINALVHPERYLANGESSKSIPRASMTNGKSKYTVSNDATGDTDIERLRPDTSLLFRGYLESGRMVNVYDWYTSFKEGLDARRRAARTADQQTKMRSARGKKSRRGNGVQSRSLSRPAPPSPIKRGRGKPARGASTRGASARDGVTRGRRGKGRPAAVFAESDAVDGDKDETSDDESEDDMTPAERELWDSEVQARFIRSLQELDMLGFMKHTGRKAEHVHKTVYELAEYK